MTMVTILQTYSSKLTFQRLFNTRELVREGLVNPGNGANRCSPVSKWTENKN